LLLINDFLLESKPALNRLGGGRGEADVLGAVVNNGGES